MTVITKVRMLALRKMDISANEQAFVRVLSVGTCAFVVVTKVLIFGNVAHEVAHRWANVATTEVEDLNGQICV